jgi:hypothetical protein
MKGRIANAPKSSKSCGHHLHIIPAFCKKSRLLVNKNLGLAKTESGRDAPQSDAVYSSIDPIRDKISKFETGSLTSRERRQLNSERERLPKKSE